MMSRSLHFFTLDFLILQFTLVCFHHFTSFMLHLYVTAIDMLSICFILLHFEAVRKRGREAIGNIFFERKKSSCAALFLIPYHLHIHTILTNFPISHSMNHHADSLINQSRNQGDYKSLNQVEWSNTDNCKGPHIAD